MSEIDSSPEIPKIPENWKFPERDQPDLKPVQIDNDARFLAFTVPDGRGLKSVEYFFNREGEAVGYYRIPFLSGAAGIAVTSDCKTQYVIPSMLSGTAPENIYVLFKKAESKLGTFATGDRLGAVFYHQGELSSIQVDPVFLERPEEEDSIESPKYQLSIINSGVLLSLIDRQNDYFHGRRKFTMDNFVIDSETKKAKDKVEVFEKNGKEVFEIKWEIREGDREEGRKESLVVSQTHIPSGIIKTLRAPLMLDMQKVEEAVYSRPPYPKERIAGKDRLIVPWRNIDRIVGASLSYSYLPPNPKHS